jgi:hypothetical protein
MVLCHAVPGRAVLQGLDVKRHCYDSWFSALHTDVNITIVDYK